MDGEKKKGGEKEGEKKKGRKRRGEEKIRRIMTMIVTVIVTVRIQVLRLLNSPPLTLLLSLKAISVLPPLCLPYEPYGEP